MPITPDSTSSLYLCTVELDPDYNYTVDFDSVLEQQQFFKDRVVDIFNNNDEPNHTYSYIKASDTINVEANIDDLLNVNYLYYYNTDKIYYAFITSKDYVNDNTTKLHFDIDVLQTFRDDYEIKESFIEREHQDRMKRIGVTNDYKRLYNIKNEHLNVGEELVTEVNAKLGYKLPNTQINQTFAYIFVKWTLSNQESVNYWTDDNGKPTGFVVYLACESQILFKDDSGTTFTINSYDEVLHTLSLIGDNQVVQVVYSSIPPFEFNYNEQGGYYYTNSNTKVVPIQYPNEEGTLVINILNRIPFLIKLDEIHTGAIPEPNKDLTKSIIYESKLFNYPYNYSKIKLGDKELTLKAEDGNTTIYAYQSISNEATTVISVINDNNRSAYGISIPFIDPDRSISLQLPFYCTLHNDAWLAYLNNNRAQRISGYLSQGLNLATGLASLGLGIGMKNTSLIAGGGATTLHGIAGIVNQVAMEEDLQNKPIDERLFAGDLSVSEMVSELQPMQVVYSIKDEYKKQVYDYLYHYGYTCKEFKIPNVKSRYYFNYLKTSNVNIKSTIDKNYLDKIKSIYNNGITFWHYRNGNWKEVNNYEYENAETFN